MRRTTRVGERSGSILEDLGVEPDIAYRMTRGDVTGRNEGLIDRAIAELASRRVHAIDTPEVQRHRDRAPTLRVTTENVDRIETTVDGRAARSRTVRAGKVTIELAEALRPDQTGSVTVHLLGFEGAELVAERRASVEIA